MSKVFAVSCYKYQTKHKLRSFLISAQEAGCRNATEALEMVGGVEEEIKDFCSEADAILYASMNLEFPLLNDENLEIDLGEHLDAIRSAYEGGFRMRDVSDFRRIVNYRT